MGIGDEGPSGSSPECCMCGDYGLSSELFKCKECRFRSQHKYCSNLYPEADSYGICNWCAFSRRDEKVRGTTPINRTSSLSSHKTSSGHRQDYRTTNKTKRIIRRTTSGEVSNDGMVKRVFRNKVRRYKLLDEVSS